MVSLEAIQTPPRSMDQASSSPRISFSAEFLDDNNFISITPNPVSEKQILKERDPNPVPLPKSTRNPDFEFLSSNTSSHNIMLTADELFFEGKLLPFWHIQQQEKLNKITLNTKEEEDDDKDEGLSNNKKKKDEPRIWFVDDDPSPRPPKCTVLWKELLRLKKQRANSSLSPSSSSSSTSSSSSSLADAATKEDEKGRNGKSGEKQAKRIKKGLERTRSASIRIRPMVNVPIYTQVRNSSLPPLFPLKKVRLEKAKG